MKNNNELNNLAEVKLELLRRERNKRLAAADIAILIAEDVQSDTSELRQYRQALRDIPRTYSNLEDVVWPQKPSLPQASA